MSRLLLLVFAVLVVTLPVGFALGQGFGEPESEAVPAADCPHASEVMKSTGVAADYFIPDCPTDAELNDLTRATPASPALIEGCRAFLERNPDAPQDHMCVQIVAAAQE